MSRTSATGVQFRMAPDQRSGRGARAASRRGGAEGQPAAPALSLDAAGLSNQQIATSLGIVESSVYRIRAELADRIAAARLGWPGHWLREAVCLVAIEEHPHPWRVAEEIAIGVGRYTTGALEPVLALLDRADAELVDALRPAIPTLLARAFTGTSRSLLRVEARLRRLLKGRRELLEPSRCASRSARRFSRSSPTSASSTAASSRTRSRRAPASDRARPRRGR